MRRLRVVTYNVQRWHDFDAILATLERLKPEVLALNEVHAGGEHAAALETVRSRLAMASAHFFGHALDGAYGNAVLTRAASTAVARRHLAGGSVVRGRGGAPHRIARGALVVALGDLQIVATHLDHMAEAERATQVADLLAGLGATAGATLLCGDLNALRRRDYGAGAWAALEAEHARNGWRGPDDSDAPGGAVAALEAAGFGDLGASDAAPTSPAAAPARRIDYVFAGAELGARAAATVDANAAGSDHLPAIFDVELPN